MKQLIHFNLVWGIIFSGFTLVLFIVFKTDDKWNTPLSVEQYTSRCGKTFDYYAGYCYLTTNDSRNRDSGTKFEFDIAKKTFVRYLYLCLYTCLWFLGSLTPSYIRNFIYEFNLSEADLAEHRSEYELVYRFEDYFFIFISTIISLYGVYYSGVYLSNFWHN